MSQPIQLIYHAFLSAYDTVALYQASDETVTFLKNDLTNIPNDTPLSKANFSSLYFTKAHIHPDDLYLFELHFSAATLARYGTSGYSGLLFSYRSKIHHTYSWYSIHLFAAPEATPSEIVICRKHIRTEDADMLETLERYNHNVYKIIKCNLSNGTFRIIKQRESETYIRSKYIKNEHKLHEEWLIESGLIHDDDTERFNHFTNHEFILDYFNAGNDELTFFYRRKIGGFYKWVRLVITKATEYTDSNLVYTYIIEDIDNMLTSLLDHSGRYPYFKDQTTPHHQAEIYHDNLTQVLSYITQKYIDFYMIDLKKDLYIIYKLNPETVSGDTPFVGTYSAMSKAYVSTKMGAEQGKQLLPFATPDAFRKMLKDKTSIEYTFTHVNGQPVKTICTKIESENGIPTKVICITVPFSTEKLLKVKTFGNFDAFHEDGSRIHFNHRQSKELFAYLVDKQGYPVSTKDIVTDILEKDPSDKTAVKYVSALAGYAIKSLAAAGYKHIIIKEWNSLRVDTSKLDCDYYHLIGGDASYFHQYHNEYMKEYSWAEETNAEILHW